jgi:hypothetical protein
MFFKNFFKKYFSNFLLRNLQQLVEPDTSAKSSQKPKTKSKFSFLSKKPKKNESTSNAANLRLENNQKDAGKSFDAQAYNQAEIERRRREAESQVTPQAPSFGKFF